MKSAAIDATLFAVCIVFLVAFSLSGCASPRTDWAGISKGVGQVTK